MAPLVAINPYWMTTVTLVVPCYNEAERLDLDQFRRHLDRRSDFRLIFVDDGSTDRTAELLETFCEQSPQSSLVRLPENQGKGVAVRSGFLAALETDTDFIGYWDADLAVPLNCAEDLLKVMEEHQSVLAVLGARVKLLGCEIEQEGFRHNVGRMFAHVVSWVLGAPIYDPQCGHKLFRKSDVVVRVFSEPFHSRWIFDVEILARIMRLTGARGEGLAEYVRELPLRSVQDVPGSKVNLRSYAVAARDFWTIRKNEVAPARKDR